MPRGDAQGMYAERKRQAYLDSLTSTKTPMARSSAGKATAAVVRPRAKPKRAMSSAKATTTRAASAVSAPKPRPKPTAAGDLSVGAKPYGKPRRGVVYAKTKSVRINKSYGPQASRSSAQATAPRLTIQRAVTRQVKGDKGPMPVDTVVRSTKRDRSGTRVAGRRKKYGL